MFRSAIRRFSSSSPAPPTASFAELAKRLDKPWNQHAMEKNSNEDPEKCPFLQTNEYLMRAAKRESNCRTYARRVPISVAKAQGCTITDTNGNQYLDILANAGTLSLGHNHPVVVDAIKRFLDSGAPLQLLDINSPWKDAFFTDLLSIMPEGMSDYKIMSCGPTGTDAVETALKLAQINTKSHVTISFHGAYHGHTNGSLALMGNVAPKTMINNLAAGVQVAPYPYAYRCPFGIGEKGHETMSYYLERMLDDVESGVRKPGAVILECIQGEGGVVPAPVEWLREVRRITKERNIMMIVDEVQAGFFRSGKTFAFEHAGIKPDIITMSKALGGSLPMAAVVYRRDLDVWVPGTHAGTFRGNNMSYATGSAAIRWSIENNLAAEAERKGQKLRAHLKKVQSEFPDIIGDVRGRGLMLGCEMVNPKGKKDKLGSLPPSGEIAFLISGGCLQRGMLCERGGRHSSVVRFLPPLIITDAEIDRVGEIFHASVKAAAERWAKQ